MKGKGRAKRGKAAYGQYPLDILRPEGRLKALAGFLPELGPGEVAAFHAELGPAEFQWLLDRSDLMVKDIDQDEVTVAYLTSAMASHGFDQTGDPVILDRRARVIEGLKRVKAYAAVGATARVLVVYGVDNEARFSTDGWLRKATQRKPVTPEQASPLTEALVDMSKVPARHRAGVRDALGLRDYVTKTMGYPVLTHWTAASLSSAADKLPERGLAPASRGLSLFLRACVDDVAPGYAGAFFQAWADPSSAPGSAPALLAASPHRPASVTDDMRFIKACGLAIEAFVDGRSIDPYRAGSCRLGERHMHILVGPPGRRADALVTCRRERLGSDAMRAMLAAAGRPMESLDDADRFRLAPLIYDLRRDKGPVLTGQTVKATAAGTLIDGHDMLAACVIAGCDYDGFVARGFREGFRPLRRYGRKQSAGHRYYADGTPHPYDVSSALALVHRVAWGDRNLAASATTIRALHLEHPHVQRAVMVAHPLKRAYRIMVSGSAAAHVCMSRFSRDLADSFFAEFMQVVDGKAPVDLPRHQPIRALKAALDKLNGSPDPSPDGTDAEPDDGDDNPLLRERSDQTFAYFIEAMDAWCREEIIEAFPPLPARGYPMLRTPPQVTALRERLQGQAA